MTKYLYLSVLFLVLFFTNCKKSGNNPAPATGSNSNSAAIAQLQAALRAGKGTWKLLKVADTMYDAKNKVVFTLTGQTKGYWVFSPSVTDEANSFNGLEWEVLDDPRYYVDDFTYSFSFQSGKSYMVLANTPWEIKALTTTSLIIVQPDKNLSYPSGTNTFATADHGGTTWTYTKYE